MRLIDADALKEEWIKDTGRAFPADYFIFTIDRSPTIDAVPVVRGRWRFRSNGHNITRTGDYEEWHECSV